ncbi:uncharacterized protein PAC_02177 [Phialocephala subalpina]|uniref:Uncharacterized protein n=1 Tax=Phialocephala subalpina TaxID=576137 RepID=A0A1L7WHQ8_9HELO|nr:uncharacterized protein PAC_02177 [Phialocephala subalpina]
MAEPLTFGAELEFLVATVIDRKTKEVPKNDRETAIDFPINQEDIDFVGPLENMFDDADSQTSSKLFFSEEYHAPLRCHVVETLQEAGLPAAINESLGKTDIKRWEVAGDESVKVKADEGEDDEGWDWIDVEVVSPAFSFTEKNLEKVRNVCALLRRTFKFRLNLTTSMHAHVGDGRKFFPFSVVQIESTSYGLSNRSSTRFVPFPDLMTFMEAQCEITAPMRKDGRTSPLQGLLSLMKCQTMDELVTDVSNVALIKNSQVNFTGVKAIASGIPIGSTKEAKPTIEFRQHAETLSGNAAVLWIKTVVRIVDYVRNAAPVDFLELIMPCKDEKWEKLGDGKDDEREAALGPIVAEDTFSAVDLFARIGLDESADYYDERVNIHNYPPRCIPDSYVSIDDGSGEINRVEAKTLPPLLTTWTYKTAFEKETDEYKLADDCRKLWESMTRTDELMQDVPNYVLMDPNADYWPAHQTLTVLPDPTYSTTETESSQGSQGSQTEGNDNSQGKKRKASDSGESSTTQNGRKKIKI